MRTFTPICQRYTDVMAHKYYLQHTLFQEARNFSPVAIMQLTIVVIKLQVLASHLQTAQVYMHLKTCIVYIYMLISDGRRW